MSPHRVISIAQLTLRDAARSRLLLTLASLILVITIAIPSLIDDLSSPSDRLSVVLEYSMNAVLFILTVGTLWAACIAVAGDIADRRIHLVLAKPVYRHEVWIGKWLGLVVINLILLILACLLIGGGVFRMWRSIPDGAARRDVEARLLTARSTLLPDLPPALNRGEIQSAMLVPPGGSLTLRYRIPGETSTSLPSELRYSMESSRPDRLFVSGTWSMSRGSGPIVSIPFTNAPHSPSRILLPPLPTAGTAPLSITFTRNDTNNSAVLLLAPHGNPPVLLTPVGGFAPNLFRAVLVSWFRLSFVAALGVTMGSLLSLPVSVFAAFALLIVLHMGGFIATVASSGVILEDHHGVVSTSTRLDHALLVLLQTVNRVTGPMERLNALPLLAEGRLVSWTMTARALGLLAFLYSAAVFIPGIWLFNRREFR